MRSTNMGQNWTMMLNNMNIYTTETNGNDIYAGTTLGVYRSTNNGVNWASASLSSYYIRSIGVIGTNIYAGAANFGIFYTTNNGANWNQSVIANQDILSLAVNGNKIFAGGNSSELQFYGDGVFLSTNNGTNWTQTAFTAHPVYCITISGNSVLIGTETGIYLSTNDGSNWTQAYGNNQMIMAIAASGSNVYAGVGANGVFKSTNGGTSWSQTSLNTDFVQAIALNPPYVFAATESTGLFMSTNDGLNWTQTNGPNVTISIAVNGNNIIAGSSNGIYTSTNNGQNWIQTTSSYLNITSLTASGSNIFAGTVDSGFYVSKNNGLDWIRKSEGMGRQTINALTISSGYVFAGMQTSAVWKRLISDIIGIKNINNKVPSSFSLYQNYPNPFNPTTNIRFEIPKNGFVKLVVFDMLGREVETLVNEKQSAGTYEATFNASRYPSGVYFYRLKTEGFSDTKKMMLIK